MPASSTASSGFTSGAASSLTVSHTSDANPLYVFLSWFVSAGGVETADIVTGMTFNGVALERGGHSGVVGNTIEWWRLATPSAGSHNLVVSLSSARRVAVGLVNLTGWPTALTDHNFDTAGSFSTTPSVTIASSSSAEVISWLGFNDPTNDVTAPAGSTALWNDEGMGSGSGAGGDQVSAGSLSPGADFSVISAWTGTVTEYFGAAALSFAEPSSRNLLTGSSHTVQGNDNLIVGSGGTVTGDTNALFALCADSPAPEITGDRTFKVCADTIDLTADTLLLNGVDADTYVESGNITSSGLTMATARLLGRTSASTGAVEEITAGTGLLLSGGTLSATGASSNGDRLIGITIDGSGVDITTGVKGFVMAPVSGTITKATLLSTDASATACSLVVDVWVDTYANYPPDNSDSITASAPPTLSSANKSQDSTLTGWSTSVTAGSIFGFNVDSNTGCTRATLMLTVTP